MYQKNNSMTLLVLREYIDDLLRRSKKAEADLEEYQLSHQSFLPPISSPVVQHIFKPNRPLSSPVMFTRSEPVTSCPLERTISPLPVRIILPETCEMNPDFLGCIGDSLSEDNEVHVSGWSEVDGNQSDIRESISVSGNHVNDMITDECVEDEHLNRSSELELAEELKSLPVADYSDEPIFGKISNIAPPLPRQSCERRPEHLRAYRMQFSERKDQDLLISSIVSKSDQSLSYF